MKNLKRIEKRIAHFQDFGNELPKAKVYYRLDWEILYFDLYGKMFGLMTQEVSESATITLKGLPEKNEELRELYSNITPGYHTNKKHWNTINLATTQLSDVEIENMIRLSYQLVVKNLPVKDRKKVEVYLS
ncbi:MmcQ/YjbR family DNA-binding protein [Candidatus Enterococcus ferrettii]|uniref:MmcQ/YjbR family DNA-binding protein n=1 Tax=Candidatus Enterococcus ferrettii TaxID=2815324 RepID=A0ABV0ES06_9ENTE|nr:MmcQ/YjbR family DNA-binding protein [Enterococcus sp. 665A]MBO1340394.1 MmcQ/YjbR family DNA-binding protein [Enterococcus sp. 665A]